MSNERIDLTQFEEITKGTWEVKEPEHPHYGVIRIHPCSATVRRYQRDWKTEEAWYANAKAIAAVPDLIAELKRCYEEIDALQGKIDDAHEAMEKYSNEEIDNVCDAYEEVCMALY
tara:strand:- start:227 stop:574 length:348 start_codon:yes stop_codon:yes gene_type:complete